MTILTAILISTINLLCFCFGFKIGQKTTNNEVLKLPNVNPVRIINAINESKEESIEQERRRIIAENIDNYDGTGIGQQDIP